MMTAYQSSSEIERMSLLDDDALMVEIGNGSQFAGHVLSSAT